MVATWTQKVSLRLESRGHRGIGAQWQGRASQEFIHVWFEGHEGFGVSPQNKRKKAAFLFNPTSRNEKPLFGWRFKGKQENIDQLS